uniref:COMM domain-containing protein 6 n=1 Tax=Myxine glutinosa TaxID=7769 RepID=UPI00358F37C1
MVTIFPPFGFPSDYIAAVAKARSLPQDLLIELSHDVMQFVQGHALAVDTTKILRRLSSLALEDIDGADIQRIADMLIYTFRLALERDATAECLESELARCGAMWSTDVLQAVRKVWVQRSPPAAPTQRPILGKVLDVQWKLGLSVGSDLCQEINEAFVVLLFRIAEPTGHVSTRVFEMNAEQFQNFFQQLHDMAAALETI